MAQGCRLSPTLSITQKAIVQKAADDNLSQRYIIPYKILFYPRN